MNDSTIADTTTNSATLGEDVSVNINLPEEQELRKVGDQNYTTKQQEKAAIGPDGIDQYELARAQVNKVAKSVNQDNIQLRKEVSLAMIKASTVFITYLSAAAYDKTQEAGNKIISAQHVLSAFKELNFPESYYKQLKKEYNEKVNPETVSAAKKQLSSKTNEDGQQDDEAMDVDLTSGNDQERALGDESIAVGDETLAAVDAAREDDEEEEDEVQEETGGVDDDE